MSAYVSLMVISDDPQALVKASEVLARTATGLAMEGADVALSWGSPDEDGS